MRFARKTLFGVTVTLIKNQNVLFWFKTNIFLEQTIKLKEIRNFKLSWQT